MDTEKLKQDINVILTAEAETQTIEWIEEREGGGRQSMLPGLTPEQTLAGDLASNHRLQSQNYTLLRALFGRLATDEEKKAFINEIEMACRYHQAATLAFLLVIKQCGVDSALRFLHIEGLISSAYLGPMLCLELLEKYVRFEHNSLTGGDIDKIAQSLNHINMYPEYDITDLGAEGKVSTPKQNILQIQRAKELANNINRTIDKIKYMRLSKDLLEGINFEINQDRDTVKHYLEQFGFPPELIESIQYVENAYQSAQSRFDYKACAGQLRSFISGFTGEVADKVAQNDGENRDKEPAKYLHDKAFFNSKQESDLFQSFIDYLSSDSVHQLSSDREVARIGKNVAIEFALLLSQRLEKYLEASPNSSIGFQADTSS